MNLQAQDPTPRREGFKMTEQIRTERIAFFTEKIGLTVEEAQTFWPVYHEMDKKKTDFFEERAGIVRRFMNEQDKLSEKEISKLLDRMVAIQQQETEIAVTYDARFRKLLPESKVMKYYMAEFQFRSFLLQKMRGKKGERRDN
jgi:Spy/CpxP family protein refolding chaperone